MQYIPVIQSKNQTDTAYTKHVRTTKWCIVSVSWCRRISQRRLKGWLRSRRLAVGKHGHGACEVATLKEELHGKQEAVGAG